MENEPVTRAWHVYGAFGHRQKMSFSPSESCDWSDEKHGIRIVEFLNADKTGTNDYTVIRITRDTAELCERELTAQISDGYFENARVGEVVEVSAASQYGQASFVESLPEQALWDELRRRYAEKPAYVSRAAAWPMIILPDAATSALKAVLKPLSPDNGGIIVNQSVYDAFPDALKQCVEDDRESPQLNYSIDDPDFRAELVASRGHCFVRELYEAYGLPYEEPEP